MNRRYELNLLVLGLRTGSALAVLETTALGDAVEWTAPPECGAPTVAFEPGTGESRLQVNVQSVSGGFVASISQQQGARVATRVLRSGSCADINRGVLVALSLLQVSGRPSEPGVAPAVGWPSGSFPSAPETTPIVPDTNEPTTSELGSAPVQAPQEVNQHLTTFEGFPSPQLPTPAKQGRTDARRAPSENSETVASERSAVALPPTTPTAELRISAGLLGATEAASAQTLGAGFAIEGRLYQLGLRAYGGFRAAVGELSGPGSVAVELAVIHLSPQACVLRGNELEWGVCAGPQFERVSGRAPSIANPRDDAQWVTGVSGALLARWSPRHHSWGAFAELQPALRPALPFNVAPYTDPVFEYPAWSVGVWLGAQFRQ